MKLAKKYAESVKLYDRSKSYELAEATKLVLDTAKAKFDETIELHVRLGVDPRQADQQVRGVLVLPNGTGKTKRATRLTRQRLRVRITWARKRPFSAYSRRTGSTSTL